MVKKVLLETPKAETWREINEAIEAASRDELLNAFRKSHKKRVNTIKA